MYFGITWVLNCAKKALSLTFPILKQPNNIAFKVIGRLFCGSLIAESYADFASEQCEL